ncbi:MAG: DUF1801 domain-containing protein [Gammaproteobacteria bacterium]
MNKKVKKYLENLPSPQKEICEKVREIILNTFPALEESFKNGVPWYECKYYLVGFKDHVNIGFSVEGLNQDEMNLFEGKGKYMRHIKIYSLDEINEKKIVKLLKLIK